MESDIITQQNRHTPACTANIARNMKTRRDKSRVDKGTGETDDNGHCRKKKVISREKS